ncbi:hypothetical protein SAMN05428938_6961 [Streptomyces sp. KS_5]|nr:hypothetical protein SAMN05428938_6961 [Streptomyces sp. KS_5]
MEPESDQGDSDGAVEKVGAFVEPRRDRPEVPEGVERPLNFVPPLVDPLVEADRSAALAAAGWAVGSLVLRFRDGVLDLASSQVSAVAAGGARLVAAEVVDADAFHDRDELRALLDRDGPLPMTGAMRIAAQVASALAPRTSTVSYIAPLSLATSCCWPEAMLPTIATMRTSWTSDWRNHPWRSRRSPRWVSSWAPWTSVPRADLRPPWRRSGDLYALACVVYEALAGSSVFQRDDDIALVWTHQNDEPPHLSEERPGLAPAPGSVMAKALSIVTVHAGSSWRRRFPLRVVGRDVQDELLLDVVSASLGFETYDGTTSKVTERNATMPTLRGRSLPRVRTARPP